MWGRRPVRRGLVAVAAVLGGATAVGGAAVLSDAPPAGACTLAGSMLTLPESVAAGGTLTISGQGFFDIDGEVGADCGGDYQLVPREGVVITVTFQTPSGPKVVELDAPVTAGDEGAAERFTVGPFEVDVPGDATAATVRSGGAWRTYDVAVTGGPTTTTTTTNAPPSEPPAADPLDGTPGYTG